jgi:hypothetical protein
MPIKNANRTKPALNHYKHISYETLAASWLTEDGWEVFFPIVDHDKKTDILIADDHNFYRIQVKAINTLDEDYYVDNKWKGKKIDYVIFFSMQGNWGYITKPFQTNRAKLNSQKHIRFSKHRTEFLKAFNKI